METANLDAMYDARAVVRWLVKHSRDLRVDTNRIAAFGASAGAMTVAMMTAVPGEGDSGNPGFPSNITAGIALSGVLLPEAYGNITRDEPPYLAAAGNADPGVCDPKECNVKEVKAAMDKVGAVNDLIIFPGQGHVPF